MNELGKIIQVILLSSVKFVAGPPFMYYDSRYDFSNFETVFYCVIGGMLGVFIFTFLSGPFFRLEHFIVDAVRRLFKKQDRFSPPVADVDGTLEVRYEYVDRRTRRRKVFTKRNRRIVWIWKRYGLSGIAVITPVLLSIPIGTIFANSLEKNKKKIFLYMFVSILLWSIAFTMAFELLHVATVKDMKDAL